MIQYDYRISFTTPAFLGNADQIGQWRTPPIKALLRQWWRVAFAAGRHTSVDVDDMRRQEGLLFGVAADGREGSRKSRIRIRLDRWDIGKLKTWDRLEQAAVHHPEVERTHYKVGPHAYLGFGPLDGRNNTKFSDKANKLNAAIQADETATLSLAFEDTQQKILERILWLVAHYGTLGGRSRNGWGSVSLASMSDGSPKLDGLLESVLMHDWRRALKLDWPHAIGCDEDGPLMWRTPVCGDWKTLMRQLAEIKIDLRTQFSFKTGKNAPFPEPRHWLSYPVTNHNVQSWKERGRGDLRLPNSLRFKVRRDDKGQLYGVIVHVPCAPPAAFRPDIAAIEQVWSRVHRFLDDPAHGLTRIPA